VLGCSGLRHCSGNPLCADRGGWCRAHQERTTRCLIRSVVVAGLLIGSDVVVTYPPCQCFIAKYVPSAPRRNVPIGISTSRQCRIRCFRRSASSCLISLNNCACPLDVRTRP